ncbi:MAG: substrate-binding domain-containing protein [Euryhalocaulis sp.]|uniref:substrate-binding domain-containing protein n=1 Tax=Euryhalocaulis sp. TaxID=2744307 RepID=UPI0017E45422|nr:substrate-binding domain-containing protein [Euryhalocaulis sp.]MBA4801870.1 substrate-binding domain-containing protein [Euryhalocaulis sp.]
MANHRIFLVSTICAAALAACGSESGPASDTGAETAAPAASETAGQSEAIGQSTGVTSGQTIQIVGSSTVYPFTTAVAEQFGARTAFSTPIVESTGTGGGMKLFCAGVGSSEPDFTNASRRIKASEFEMCQENGVSSVVEIPVGYDGIVISNVKSSPAMDITSKQLFTALAKQIPASDDDCTMQDNPYTNWSEIDPALPDETIEVYGPPPTSGTRDAFVELGMAKGAAGYACLAEMEESDGDRFEAIAHTLREDQRWIDAGENDNAIVQTLTKTPTAFGVFGYSFLEQNQNRLQGAMVDGVEPSFDNIASGDYPISRTLFVYAKGQHAELVPGFQEFVNEYTSEEAMGEFGYLTEKGLIPLPADRVEEVRAASRALEPMAGPPSE